MSRLAIRHVSCRYGPVVALEEVTLDVPSGQCLVLLGPSGCGKSTLLRCIAGLEQPSSGAIELDGRPLAGVPPAERDVAMVFQDYALYPHLTVAENLGFGAKARGTPPAELAERVAACARRLQLEQLLARRPAELSGGQRQRVAVGRALARRPKLFLFDEPLSNLDARLRSALRAELRALLRELAVTSVYVTHDQVEAMTLGDRIAVLRAGRLEQAGTPAEIYGEPATRFVASFLGTPPMNLLDGRIEDSQFEASGAALVLAAPGRPAGPASVGVRAEHLRLAAEGPLRGRVVLVERLGHEALVHVELAARPGRAGERAVWIARAPADCAAVEGEAAALAVADGAWKFFVGRSDE